MTELTALRRVATRCPGLSLAYLRTRLDQCIGISFNDSTSLAIYQQRDFAQRAF